MTFKFLQMVRIDFLAWSLKRHLGLKVMSKFHRAQKVRSGHPKESPSFKTSTSNFFFKSMKMFRWGQFFPILRIFTISAPFELISRIFEDVGGLILKLRLNSAKLKSVRVFTQKIA